MTSARTAVPQNAVDVAQFAADFAAKHGFPPIAGGETMAGVPPVAPPAPDPAAAAPAPAPAPAPAAPDPAAAAPEGEQRPAWVDDLVGRFDALAPPTPPDPYAVDLGLMPPAPAMPGVPQGQPGAPVPGAPQPQGAPPAPGQPQPGGASLPVGTPEEQQVIQHYIRQQAQEVAREMIRETVEPQFQAQQTARRRSETEALVEDNPEYRDPQKAAELMARARNWSQQLSGSEDLAREPGFLELTIRASKQMAAEQAAAAAGNPQVPAPAPGTVPIEAPGGAAPAGVVSPADQRGREIVAAGNGSGLSALWH